MSQNKLITNTHQWQTTWVVVVDKSHNNPIAITQQKHNRNTTKHNNHRQMRTNPVLVNQQLRNNCATMTNKLSKLHSNYATNRHQTGMN